MIAWDTINYSDRLINDLFTIDRSRELAPILVHQDGIMRKNYKRIGQLLIIGSEFIFVHVCSTRFFFKFIWML